MTSLSSILSTSISGLDANQAGLAVVSNNVANSNNPNYSQQTLITTPGIDAEGNLSQGTGVQITGVQGIRDNLLNQQVNTQSSLQSSADTLNSSLSGIQPLFSISSDSGLLQSITSFFNSFQTLATNPSSSSFQQQVQSSASSMIAGFQQLNSDLTQQATQANETIPGSVSQINSLASQIANINAQIQQNGGNTSQNSNLIDQREALVQQISKIAGVQEINNGGTYEINIGNDMPLVQGSTAYTLTTGQGTDGNTDVFSGQTDITSQITGGSMQAEIALRDTYIPKYLSATDQLAYNIVTQVNTIHSTGYNANGTTGINFFAPLSSSSDASADMALSAQVAADPANIATASQAGDNDNSIATQLGNLVSQPAFDGGSVSQQYGNLVYMVGSDASNASSASTEQDALTTQLQNQQQSISGVSIDEETTQMLQYQRAYQASAQLINAINQMMQTAIGLGTTT